MQVLIFLLLTVLHVTEGCTLENRGTTVYETAHTGGSVLLPCYCTDLQTTPETFTWKKYNRNTWEMISNSSGQYRNRVQLVKGHSPGNLSLLISHLTEKDGGDYQCDVKDVGHTYISLTVKGCTLENSRTYHRLTAHTGGSVLLPCYCTDLHTKPETFTWKKYNTERNTWEVISSESGQYRNRVQLVNGHSPGNLSLLISHLNEEDGGGYMCELTGNKYKDIQLTVQGSPTKATKTSTPVVYSRAEPSTMMPFQNDPPNPATQTNMYSDFFIYGAVGGFLLLMLIGGVICWRHRAKRREQMDTHEGKTEQRTDQEAQDCPEVLYCTIPSEPTDKADKKQNDSEAMYASVNLQSKRKKAQEKDDMTYSTIDHSKASTPAHKLMDTGETTEYASIKLN